MIQRPVNSRNSASTCRFCDSRNSINRSDSTSRNALRPDIAPIRPITATPRMLDSSIAIRILDWMPNRKRVQTQRPSHTLGFPGGFVVRYRLRWLLGSQWLPFAEAQVTQQTNAKLRKK